MALLSKNNQDNLDFNRFNQDVVASFISVGHGDIVQSKDHVLLGISPFNSYYSEQKISRLIRWAHSNFKNFHLFVPDTLPYYNFLAMGYAPNRAKTKTRRQWNYLKNKIHRAFIDNGFAKNDISAKIVTISETMSNNIFYDHLFKSCLTKYENDLSFREDCISFSKIILGLHANLTNIECTKESLRTETAVQYLLRELPLLLNTPKILGVESSIFVYHEAIDFFKELYSKCNNDLLSDNQGFLVLKL